MIGAISGAYSYYGAYNPYMAVRAGQQAGETQALQRASILAGRKVSTPETPVEPVRPVTPVNAEETPARLGPVIRDGADPAEMAVRMRIKPYEDPTPAAQNALDPQKTEDENQPGSDLKVGAESAQAAVEDGKCQTCEKRKYQDESDDMGVSFQTPTNISPEQVASAVRGHENEHVVREQAKAQREDRKVVSQSVTLHTDICPECGKVYISGGTTRTVTAADNKPEDVQQAEEGKEASSAQG
ncbi:MAG: hypothetical protein K2N78_09720 [Oscillospiraceae bacterium]|nr:hypothetical protein [Oscillospiraceae bacterium]